MITLSLETSTVHGSAALLRDGALVGERTWTESRSLEGGLFAAVRDLAASASVRLSEVDRYAVGIGPGNYSSLRIAVAAAHAFALPGGLPVVGVSSGAAAADEWLAENAAAALVVVGDARRGHLWRGDFRRLDDGRTSQRTAWSLAAPKDLPAAVGADAAVGTPDWERLRETLGRIGLRDAQLIREPLVPKARFIAKLAEWADTDTPSPARPIYLHPAVAAKP